MIHSGCYYCVRVPHRLLQGTAVQIRKGKRLPDAAARENLELWSKLTVKRSLEDRIEKLVCVGESERGGQTERQGQISHFEFHALSVSIRHEQKHQLSVSQISRACR